MRFVKLALGNSKSNYLGAQGTCDPEGEGDNSRTLVDRAHYCAQNPKSN